MIPVRLTIPAATGLIDVTSSGMGGCIAFMPVSVSSAAEAPANEYRFSVGVCDGVNGRSCAVSHIHNQATTNTDRLASNNALRVIGGNGVTNAIIEFDSFITDGVRLNVIDAPASAIIVDFMLFPASVFSAATVVQQGLGTSTGEITVATPGITPDVVIALSNNGSNTLNSGASFSFLSVGIGTEYDGLINQMCFGNSAYAAYPAGDVSQAVFNDAICAQVGDSSVSYKVSLSSLSVDSFGITPSASAANDVCFFLALELQAGKVARTQIIDTPAAVGSFSYSDAPFQPDGGLALLSSSTSLNSHSKVGAFGISLLGGSNQYSVAAEEVNAADPTENYVASYAKPFALVESGVLALDMGSFAFTADGFTANAATVPTSAKKMGLLFVGEESLPVPTLSNSSSNRLSDSFTLTGTNLTGVTAVAIGGTAAQSFSAVSATEIAGVWPDNVAGEALGSDVDIEVTTPGGTAALGVTLDTIAGHDYVTLSSIRAGSEADYIPGLSVPDEISYQNTVDGVDVSWQVNGEINLGSIDNLPPLGTYVVNWFVRDASDSYSRGSVGTITINVLGNPGWISEDLYSAAGTFASGNVMVKIFSDFDDDEVLISSLSATISNNTLTLDNDELGAVGDTVDIFLELDDGKNILLRNQSVIDLDA